MVEDKAKQKDDEHGPLHVFVNRRKFEEGDGVKREMSGAEIAALVEVPAENAVIRWEHDQAEIGIAQIVRVKNADRFLVTRKVVEGGDGTGAN